MQGAFCLSLCMQPQLKRGTSCVTLLASVRSETNTFVQEGKIPHFNEPTRLGLLFRKKAS